MSGVPHAIFEVRAPALPVRCEEEVGLVQLRSTTRVGDLMRLARQAIACDQEAFADQTNVSSRTVSRWETGALWPTPDQRALIVRALAAAPRAVVDELARLLGVASPYPAPEPVVASAPPAPRPAEAEVRASLDAVVLAAAEERDVLPRHLRAFGVELLLAVDRAGIGAKEAASLVAARQRPPRGPSTPP
jgi:DNA-binding transcriptional regulator YiaG